MSDLQNKKNYVNKLVTTTLSQCKRIKEVTVKFRNNKFATAATTWEYETTHPTIIFSKHWLEKLPYSELKNLVLHECAHIIAKDGHTKKFRRVCCKIGVTKKWQGSYAENVVVSKNE